MTSVERQRAALRFGSQIALRVDEDEGDGQVAYVSSKGHADPRLLLRRGRRSADGEPLPPQCAFLAFEDSVFTICRPLETHTSASASDVTYGARFCLQHRHSGMFVALMAAQPAASDPTCDTITLIEPNESHSNVTNMCQFRFVPRFKIHSEGDCVCTGDRVQVQLFDRKVSFHVSQRASAGSNAVPTDLSGSMNMSGVWHDTVTSLTAPTFADTEEDMCAEVNGGEFAASWTLHRYDIGSERPVTGGGNKGPGGVPLGVLKAGCPIVLFHREKEALLVSSVMSPTSKHQGGIPGSFRLSGFSPGGGPTAAGAMAGGSPAAAGGGGAKTGTRSRGTSLVDNRSAPVQFSPLLGKSTDGASAAASAGVSPAISRYGSMHKVGGSGDDDGSLENVPLFSQHETFKEDVPFEADISVSCSALWLFEALDPTTGGPVRFGQLYRLRQAATSMYLAVLPMNTSNLSRQSSTLSMGAGAISPFGGREVSTYDELEWNDNTSKGGGGGNGQGLSTSNAASRSGPAAFKLCLVAPPTTFEEDAACLFFVSPFFVSSFMGSQSMMSAQVHARDLVRIQHRASGLYFRTELTRREGELDDVFVGPGGSLGRSSSFRHQRNGFGKTYLLLDPVPASHDALLPSHVHPKLQRDVFFLFHVGGILQRYAQKFVAAPRDRAFKLTRFVVVVQETTSALTDLIRFCTTSEDSDPLTREGLPISENQRMMLDLQFHRLVFNVLVAPFTSPPPSPVVDSDTGFSNISVGFSALPQLPLTGGVLNIDNLLDPTLSSIHNICRLCYRLLKQMVKGSPVFSAKLAPFIPYMYSQDGLKLHVADTMLAIFTDNSLLPSHVYRTAADHYIKLLKGKNKSAGYLKFLSTMCAVGDRGIRSNQDLVARLVLRENPTILISTRILATGDVAVELPPASAKKEKEAKDGSPAAPAKEKSTSSSSSAALSASPTMGSPIHDKDSAVIVPLSSFLANGDPKQVKFFESQIDLLHKLCLDASPQCVAMVEAMVPRDQLHSIVSRILSVTPGIGVPSKLDGVRATFFRLAMHLYVIRDLSQFSTQLRCITTLLPGSALRPRHESLSGLPDTPLIDAIKRATLNILATNSGQVIEHTTRNTLIGSTFEMWLALIVRSQFTAPECETLIPVCLKILSGEQDQLSTKKLRSAASWNRYDRTEDNLIAMRTKEICCRVLNALLWSAVRMQAAAVVEDVNRWCVAGGSTASTATTPTGAAAAGILVSSGAHSAGSDPRALVLGAARHTSTTFHVDKLVPILVDIACYDDTQLTAEAMELLVAQCDLHGDIAREVLVAMKLAPKVPLPFFDTMFDVVCNLMSTSSAAAPFPGIIASLKSFLLQGRPEDKSEKSDANAAAEGGSATKPSGGGGAGRSLMGLVKAATAVAAAASQPSTSPPVVTSTDSAEEAESGSVNPTAAPAEGDTNSPKPLARRDRRLSMWGTARAAVSVIAFSKLASKTPRFVDVALSHAAVGRSECMRHWAVHLVLLDKLADMSISHQAYVPVMEFFYYFSLTPSNAAVLGSYVPLFLLGLSRPEAHDYCMFIVMSVLSATTMPIDSSHLSAGGSSGSVSGGGGAFGLTSSSSPAHAEETLLPFLAGLYGVAHANQQGEAASGGAMLSVTPAATTASRGGSAGPANPAVAGAGGDVVSRDLIQRLVDLLAKEIRSSAPNQSFVRLINRTIIGRQMVPANQKHLLYLLGRHDVLQYVADAEFLKKASEHHLSFNSSLVMLMCNCCIGNSASRHVVQRVLPASATLTVLRATAAIARPHRMPYYRVLSAVFFVFEESSHQEHEQLKMSWTNNMDLWTLMQNHDVTVFHEAASNLRVSTGSTAPAGNNSSFGGLSPSAVAEQMLKVSEYFDLHRDFIFGGVLGMHAGFFADVFHVATATRSDTICSAVSIVTSAAIALAQATLESQRAKAIDASMTEWGLLRRLLVALQSHCEQLEFTSLSDTLQTLMPRVDTEAFAAAQRTSLEAKRSIAAKESHRSGGVGADRFATAIHLLTQISRDNDDSSTEADASPFRSAAAASNRSQAAGLLISHFYRATSAASVTANAYAGLPALPSSNALGAASSHGMSAGNLDACLAKLYGHLRQMELVPKTTVGLLRAIRASLGEADQRGTLEDLQSHYDRLGAMKVVTSLVDSADDAVLREALLFGIAILEGGNKSVQDNLLKYFEAYDERFFLSIREIIVAATTTAKQTNLHRQQQLLLVGSAASSNSSSSVVDILDDGGLNGGIHAFKHIKLVFRLLQLLCEGHHLGMQHYVREQRDNLHSINILKDVVTLMSELCVCIDANNVSIVTRGLALFTEFCQGPCFNNQMALLNDDVCTLLCHAFRYCESGVDDLLLETLHSAATTTLLSLLEGCNDAKVYRKVLSQVPIATLADLMNSVYQDGMLGSDELLLGAESEEEEDAAEPLELEDDDVAEKATGSNQDEAGTDIHRSHAAPNAQVGSPLHPPIVHRSSSEVNEMRMETLFNIIIFAHQIRPYAAMDADLRLLDDIDQMLRCFQHLSTMLGIIEIERGDRLERVYFRIPPICLSLPEKSRDKLLWNVDRSTRTTKLADFFSKSDELIFEMEQTHHFQRLLAKYSRFRMPKHPSDLPAGGVPSASWSALPQAVARIIRKRGSRSSWKQLVSSVRNVVDASRVTYRVKLLWNAVVPFVFTHQVEYYENLSLLLAMLTNFCLLYLSWAALSNGIHDIAVLDAVLARFDQVAVNASSAGGTEMATISDSNTSSTAIANSGSAVGALLLGDAAQRVVVAAAEVAVTVLSNTTSALMDAATTTAVAGHIAAAAADGGDVTSPIWWTVAIAARQWALGSLTRIASLIWWLLGNTLSLALSCLGVSAADDDGEPQPSISATSDSSPWWFAWIAPSVTSRWPLINVTAQGVRFFGTAQVVVSLFSLVVDSCVFLPLHFYKEAKRRKAAKAQLSKSGGSGNTGGFGAATGSFSAARKSQSGAVVADGWSTDEEEDDAALGDPGGDEGELILGAFADVGAVKQPGEEPPRRWYQRGVLAWAGSRLPSQLAVHRLQRRVRRLRRFALRLPFALTRFQTIYRLTMLSAAVAGAVYSPLFFAVHLCEAVHKSSVLQNVIVAITQNSRSLILTMGLGVVMVYFFSIVGLHLFADDFGSASDQPNQENCSTLLRCFAFILMNGLRQGGGVGDVMERQPWGSPEHLWRMAYDFLFFAFLNVVFLNILFGIVIDTFAELRDDKRKKEEDMHACCFICGLEADVLEKEGHGFQPHVKQEHNLWQYLYFMHHLRRKDESDYNGQESFVADLIHRNSLAFFPDGVALSILDRRAAEEIESGGAEGGDGVGEGYDDHHGGGQQGGNGALVPAGGHAVGAGGTASSEGGGSGALTGKLLRKPSVAPRTLSNVNNTNGGGFAGGGVGGGGDVTGSMAAASTGANAAVAELEEAGRRILARLETMLSGAGGGSLGGGPASSFNDGPASSDDLLGAGSMSFGPAASLCFNGGGGGGGGGASSAVSGLTSSESMVPRQRRRVSIAPSHFSSPSHRNSAVIAAANANAAAATSADTTRPSEHSPSHGTTQPLHAAAAAAGSSSSSSDVAATTASAEISALRQQISQLIVQNASLRTSLDLKSTSEAALHERLFSAETEKTNAKAEIRSLEDELRTFALDREEENNSYRQRLKALASDAAAAQTLSEQKLSTLQATVDAQRARIVQLETKWNDKPPSDAATPLSAASAPETPKKRPTLVEAIDRRPTFDPSSVSSFTNSSIVMVTSVSTSPQDGAFPPSEGGAHGGSSDEDESTTGASPPPMRRASTSLPGLGKGTTNTAEQNSTVSAACTTQPPAATSSSATCANCELWASAFFLSEQRRSQAEAAAEDAHRCFVELLQLASSDGGDLVPPAVL